MKKNQIIISVVVLVLVAGLSFYAGTKVGGGNSGANRGGQFSAGGAGGANGAGGYGGQGGNGMMRGGRGGAQAGAGFVSGEVLSKDATSITVKLANGGSKIIFVTAGTAVQKTVSGAITDVVVGSQITANGQANADGSINATSISQRPNIPAQGAPQGVGAQQGGQAAGAPSAR